MQCQSINIYKLQTDFWPLIWKVSIVHVIFLTIIVSAGVWPREIGTLWGAREGAGSGPRSRVRDPDCSGSNQSNYDNPLRSSGWPLPHN